MRARGSMVCLVWAVCAMLALPALATAKPGYYVSEAGRFLTMDLRGSNGYRINIFSSDSKHVTLLASKGGTGVDYRVRARVTDHSVEAHFGNRGWVSVRMQLANRIGSMEFPSHCKGKSGTAWKVRLLGSIRFRGERGFTRVSAEEAHGNLFRSYRRVCKREKRPHHHYKPPPASSLNASSSNPRLPWFSVFKEEPQGHHGLFFSEEANYTASQSERREGMWIDRSASANAPPETFAVSAPGADPVTSTVAPPAPFSGTATYERGLDGTGTWTGDLAVELPGLGQVPLTGPTYTARLCRSLGCACPPRRECSFVVVISGRPYARLSQGKLERLP